MLDNGGRPSSCWAIGGPQYVLPSAHHRQHFREDAHYGTEFPYAQAGPLQDRPNRGRVEGNEFQLPAPSFVAQRAGLAAAAGGGGYSFHGHSASSSHLPVGSPQLPPQIEAMARAAAASTSSPTATYQPIVKNTFVEIVDVGQEENQLRRSASDSDLSKSSDEKPYFWLPAFSSSSDYSMSSRSSRSTDRQTQGQRQANASSSSGKRTGDRGDDSESPGGARTYAQAGGQLSHVVEGTHSTVDPYHPARHLVFPPGTSPASATDDDDSPGKKIWQPPASSWEGDVPAIVQSLQEETGLCVADLMQAHQTCDLALVPRSKSGMIMSVGSVHHSEGKCSPCMFWIKKTCIKSVTCKFCHFKHKDAKVKRIRPSKRAREKAKAMMAARPEAFEEKESGARSATRRKQEPQTKERGVMPRDGDFLRTRSYCSVCRTSASRRGGKPAHVVRLFALAGGSPACASLRSHMCFFGLPGR